MDKRRIEFFRARDRYFSSPKSWPSLIEKREGGINHNVPSSQDQLRLGSSASNHPRTDARTAMSSELSQRKDANSGFDSQLKEPGLVLAQKKRIHAQVILYVLSISTTCYSFWVLWFLITVSVVRMYFDFYSSMTFKSATCKREGTGRENLRKRTNWAQEKVTVEG